MNKVVWDGLISKKLRAVAGRNGSAILLLLVFGAMGIAQNESSGSVAYLVDGEIHASCRLGDVTVTDAKYIENFAIDGNTLAVVRRMEESGSPSRLFVIDVKSRHIQSSMEVVGAATVRRTCGTLVLEHFPIRGDVTPAVSIDIRTGRRPKGVPHNMGLSCSQDRNVVAYLSLNERKSLQLSMIDVPAHRSAVIAEHADAVSVSPQGRFIAYKNDSKICRWSSVDRSTRCIDADALGNWIVAGDDGEIRYSATDYGNCVYHLPNQKPIVDLCVNLYSWHENEPPTLLRKRTESIQQLDSGTATLLCKRGLSPIQILAESGMSRMNK